ncbi:MAG: PD40 domain-containing protein [Gemmatimonadetes bacterium]|nr:PD40 domain-containing protein [Gemmatimonadota bacterium]
MRRRPAARALLLGALLLSLPRTARAQIPPDARWSTLETAHFRVTYGPGLDSLARHAGAVAERARSRLIASFGPPPRGTIELLLADNVDFSNGFASPLPYNHIVVYARPPVDDVSLDNYDDWLELVIDHELTHVFHLDRAGPLGQGLRSVFGRLPVSWPVFPALGTPAWNLEGTAVVYESGLTGLGRIHGSFHDMAVRTAALEGAWEPLDRLTGGTPVWPAGQGAYVFGSMFLDHLARTYGRDVQARLSSATAGQRFPSFAGVAHRVLGTSFGEAYDAWRAEAESRYRALADSLRAEGLSRPEVLTRAGYYAVAPRVSPDSRRVLYTAFDGRSAAATRVLDPRTGTSRRLSRRNDLAPADWLPDGSVLTTQLEYDGPYRLFSDVYIQGAGGEKRLTHGARIGQVDVHPDGRRAVAVQGSDGTNRIVIVDLADGGVRPVTRMDPRVNWAYPRWSPDGGRIAVGRWEQGGSYDILVLDTTGAVLAQVTRDDAVDLAPAWSPDGRWLVFGSDRSGIPNLYAADLGAAASADGVAERAAPGAGAAPRTGFRVLRVTNLLTGAFYPDVSPDRRWIYYSGYHADGYHIERVPFDTTAWRLAPPLLAARHAPTFPRQAADTTPHAGPRGYSPFPTILPHFWLPLRYGGGETGTFLGAATNGSDLVGRHAWSAALAFSPSRRWTEGSLDYQYAGLGNPVLGLGATRTWDDIGFVRLPGDGGTLTIFEREDVLAAAASLARRRARSSATLSLGGEIVRRERSIPDLPDTLRVVGFDAADRLVGAVASVAFANAQSYPFSISRENGVSLSATARRRWDTSPDSIAGTYSEATAWGAAYQGIPLFGFAHHVLALRASALLRSGPGAEPHAVGGPSGGSASLGVTTLGGFRFLPIRGFDDGVRYGTRAWTGSLEYRVPIALVGRGLGVSPYYLDRIAASAFLDAGDAWCDDAAAARYRACADRDAGILYAVGGELQVDGRVLVPATIRARVGAGVPLSAGADRRPKFWLELGSAF